MVTEGPRRGEDAASHTGELSATELRLLDAVPSGSAGLAGIAVFLLLLGWFFVYFLIYLPRGMVG
jgi:hypothetical protein